MLASALAFRHRAPCASRPEAPMPTVRPMAVACLLASMILASPAPAQVISNGAFAVEIGKNGVLVAVPERGIHTLDGPRADVTPLTAEWFGVRFDGPAGPFEAS